MNDGQSDRPACHPFELHAVKPVRIGISHADPVGHHSRSRSERAIEIEAAATQPGRPRLHRNLWNVAQEHWKIV